MDDGLRKMDEVSFWLGEQANWSIDALRQTPNPQTH